jgi:methionine-S-sulfoxide reductase
MTEVIQEKKAVFAGGCFWCVENAFDVLPEIIRAESGYSGGASENPNYENHEGHREAVQITYDLDKTNYEQLVRHFFKSIDPTDAGGQFADRGHAYTTAIYYKNDEEKKIAEKIKQEVADKLGKPVATALEPQGVFYLAEEYHQEYAEKHPVHYAMYKESSGRSAYFKAREEGANIQ